MISHAWQTQIDLRWAYKTIFTGKNVTSLNQVGGLRQAPKSNSEVSFFILTTYNNSNTAGSQTGSLKAYLSFFPQRNLLWNRAVEWGTGFSGGKELFFSLNWLINEIEILWSMFHSPKRHHGIRSPLHLYHWSASSLTAGTWCRLISTTNRDLAA